MNKFKLSAVIDIISGGTPKTAVDEYWENGTIGWLSVTDFNKDLRYVYSTEKKITVAGLKNSNTKLLNKGDIIISARGTVGALAQIGTPMCFNQSCFGLRGKKGIVDTDFLYYCLKNYVLNIKKRSQGSVFDTINLNSFDLMEIEIPDFNYQSKIAAVLSALDSKIELNNRINAELEAMAKTLYDYWFVQFDFPSKNGKPYKTNGGKMAWNEELKREIPEGWEVKEIRKFANTSSGGTPLSTKSEYYDNGTIPWINSGELNNPYILSTTNYITKQGLSSSSAKMFSAKTLLVALYGATAGKVSLLLIPACTNQAICAIIPHSEIFTNYLKFGFSDLYKYLINLSSGSARDNLSQDLIKDIKFAVPQNHLLESFDKIITTIIEQISINIKQNQHLSSLRDWLLPMLMNGQVTVGDSAKIKASYIIEEEMSMAAEPGNVLK